MPGEFRRRDRPARILLARWSMVKRRPSPSSTARLVRWTVGLLGAGIIVLGTVASSTSPVRSATSPVPETPAIERGRYLTHDVAMCVQCHSPRDERGEIIRSQEFRGAPIPVESPFPRNSWASRAPNIRGVSAYPEGALIQLLREGITKNGTTPERPMPPFRMSREDAEAIAAYLRSLD